MKFKGFLRFWLFIALSYSSIIFSHALNKEHSEAHKKFKEGYYDEAITLYNNILEVDPNNALVNFRLGLCYHYMLDEKEALRFISKVETLENVEEDLHKRFYLGRVLHLNAKFESAKTAYQEYLEVFTGSKEDFDITIEEEVVLPSIYGGAYGQLTDLISIEEAVKKLISSCEYGMQLSSNPVRVAIENVGTPINSEDAEYAPVINAIGDEIYYTSKKEIGSGEFAERLFNSHYTEDLDWSKPIEIPITSNPDADIAPLYLSPEGNTMLIYNSGSNNGDIDIIEKNGDEWTTAKSISDKINSKYWEPSGSLFPDGKTLIFSSNRPDGYGGLDLYISRLDGNNEWSKPENLGPSINTAFDEDAPFVLQDGITMYFSSRGLKGIGGYDVFKTSFENDQWVTPINMEMPINSSSDDIYFTWTQDERRAYFSSHRKGSFGESDIYYMDFDQITLQVVIQNKTNSSVVPINDLNVTLKNEKTGQFMPSIEKDDEKGLNIFFVKENELYTLRAESPNYTPYTESIRLKRGDDLIAFQNREITLKQGNLEQKNEIIAKENAESNTMATATKKESKMSAFKIDNQIVNLKAGDYLKPKVHFVFDVHDEITDYSKAQMNKVISLMEQHSDLKIQIVAHADLPGDHNYNKKLSERRAQSVKRYFIENGISQDRVHGIWKGDEDPIIQTPLPELKNRRVEFVVIDL